jgi:hypothetical protein
MKNQKPYIQCQDARESMIYILQPILKPGPRGYPWNIRHMVPEVLIPFGKADFL